MRIEHLALWVKDLEKTKDFYIKYFGGKANNKYNNSRTGFESYFITFADGARLELMCNLAEDREACASLRLGFIHIAFSVGSSEKVDELTELLRQDGYKVVSGPRRTGDGYYESCVLDPEGNQVEITV